MMGILLTLPERPPHERQRRRMADALYSAWRCFADAANHADDPATVQTLDRAAERYVDKFNDIAAGRTA